MNRDRIEVLPARRRQYARDLKARRGQRFRVDPFTVYVLLGADEQGLMAEVAESDTYGLGERRRLSWDRLEQTGATIDFRP